MPPFIAMPITMPDSTSTAPTDRSIPPVMMTAVMPIAMMATKAKLRVTLNRFCWVAKTSLASASTTNASDRGDRDPERLLADEPGQPVCRAPGGRSSPRAMASAIRQPSIAPVMRPVTSSGELAAIGLSATFSPRRSTTMRSATANTSGMRWLISTTAIAVLAQAADQVQHLGDLAHADRRRRLVHQHDLRVRQPRARDRDRLALAAGHAPHQVARPRLRLQLGEQLAGALEHAAVVQDPQRAEAEHRARARGTRSRPPSGCRTARGPGRRSRCRRRARRPACGSATLRPSSVIVPALCG